MTDRTYLWGYGSGPWGSAGRRTKAQILSSRKFAAVAPEHMRRLFALGDFVIDSGSDFGFGGGARLLAEQDPEFRRRHYAVPCPGGIWRYDGKCWQRHEWAAPYAPPGNSWHEEGSSPDGALAVDALGDHTLAARHCHEFGLVNGIADELWHYQPLEVPRARQFEATFGRLAMWPLPGGDDEMRIIDPPRRLLDTRQPPLGGKVQAGQLVVIDTKEHGAAVEVNFTVVDGNAPNPPQFLTAWGAGGQPATSNLNWDRNGQTIANKATVPLDGSHIRFTVNAPCHVIVDLQGVHG